MLNKSQTQKTTCYKITLHEISKKSQIQRDKKQVSQWFPGLEWEQRMNANGDNAFWIVINVLKLDCDDGSTTL